MQPIIKDQNPAEQSGRLQYSSWGANPFKAMWACN